ncbi:hypothetical protein BsWGS_12498 [Bradybaena similaris]
MATLTNTLRFLALRARPFLCQQQRYAGHWNKDWKPGQFPETAEERFAAAKKYGLRPEDYTCLADEEIGDYPRLPVVAQALKDQYEDYDLPGEKRNFGEPVFHNSNVVGAELYDPNTPGLTYSQNLLRFALIFFGLVGTFLFFEKYPYHLPEMPKQYPFNNLYLEKGGHPDRLQEVKHYTFEPATD